jgi:AsmA protein
MLLKHFDADLRISAGEIDAGAIKLDGGGFTITAKQGMLAAEVGELELCGGSAAGRISLDISQPATKAILVGSLTDIAVDTCVQQFALDIPFKGIGRIKTELSAVGENFSELIRGLTGSLKVTAQNGVVPIDLTRLMAATTALDGEGWSRNSATQFDSLSADCRLASGHIWCQTLNMQTRRAMISGSGDVDLGQRTLDWVLAVDGQTSPVRALQLRAERPPTVSIRGALLQPMIRRTDRSTLGAESPQTSPTATPVR